VIGVQSSTSRSSLIPIVRIVIESAALYVLEMIVLIVLYTLNNNGQFVLQEAAVPTVGTSNGGKFHFIEFARADIPNQGIVFTLMTVRLAMRSSKTLMTTTVRTGGGFPIEWRVRGSTTVATTEFGPTTLGTAGTTDIQVKSVEFGGSQSDQEAESQQVKETKDSP
jgi:hypothetical protein